MYLPVNELLLVYRRVRTCAYTVVYEPLRLSPSAAFVCQYRKPLLISDFHFSFVSDNCIHLPLSPSCTSLTYAVETRYSLSLQAPHFALVAGGCPAAAGKTCVVAAVVTAATATPCLLCPADAHCSCICSCCCRSVDAVYTRVHRCSFCRCTCSCKWGGDLRVLLGRSADNVQKSSLQRSSSNQEAIHVLLQHQLCTVFFVHASTVYQP